MILNRWSGFKLPFNPSYACCPELNQQLLPMRRDGWINTVIQCRRQAMDAHLGILDQLWVTPSYRSQHCIAIRCGRLLWCPLVAIRTCPCGHLDGSLKFPSPRLFHSNQNQLSALRQHGHSRRIALPIPLRGGGGNSGQNPLLWLAYFLEVNMALQGEKDESPELGAIKICDRL